MHVIVGQAWCYDRCIYTLTTDDLHMQFLFIIIISTVHVQFSVYKQQCSYVNEQVNGTYLRTLYRYVMKAGIYVAK